MSSARWWRQICPGLSGAFVEEASGGFGASRSELEAARQTEAQLAAIVRSSDDAMVSITTDLVITTWNHGAERLFGYSMAEMVGRKTVLIPGELQEEFDLILQQVRNGPPRTYETRRRRKDGSLVDVAVALSAMRDPGGALIGYPSVSRDITGRLKAEAELAADRAEREVLADRDRLPVTCASRSCSGCSPPAWPCRAWRLGPGRLT